MLAQKVLPVLFNHLELLLIRETGKSRLFPTKSDAFITIVGLLSLPKDLREWSQANL